MNKLIVVLVVITMLASIAFPYDLHLPQSAKLAVQKWYTLTTGSKMPENTLNEIVYGVFDICSVYNVDTELVFGIMAIESSFVPSATNGVSAGLMQVQPDTAKFMQKRYGIVRDNLFDIRTSIIYGVEYLAYLKHLGMSKERVIRSYNGASEAKTLAYYHRYLLAISKMKAWK